MDIEKRKKDETLYLIFSCKKCAQYLYAKTTQKTKKCLRCGRNHLISSMLNSGEVVRGVDNAVLCLKKKQKELAIKELGSSPDLRAVNDFVVPAPQISKNSSRSHEIGDQFKPASEQIEKIIREMFEFYEKVPGYLFEIKAEEYQIPISKLKLHIRQLVKKGILKTVNRGYYALKR